jgi:hypothetical protein
MLRLAQGPIGHSSGPRDHEWAKEAIAAPGPIAASVERLVPAEIPLLSTHLGGGGVP